jgi:hypothetical protein
VRWAWKQRTFLIAWIELAVRALILLARRSSSIFSQQANQKINEKSLWVLGFF